MFASCLQLNTTSHSFNKATVKYEEAYLKAYAGVREARLALGDCFRLYNDLRPHQALGYRTPAEVFQETMLEAMNVRGAS